MSRLCILCGERPARRSRRKYCSLCHERHIEGNGKLELPAGHPFTEERRRRVERMRQRAARGLPLFEPVDPDLS